MEDQVRQLLADLAEFIQPIADGKTESPSFIQLEAARLLERISEAIESVS